jgi:hypothetical protein
MIEFIGPLYKLLHFTNHYLRLDILDFCPHYSYNWTELSDQSQSESHIATDGQSVSQSVSTSWYRAPSGAHDQIFITVWQLQSCYCRASSLTRGRVCLLYMLLVRASAVFLGSESLGTRYHNLLSQIWDFSFRRILRLAGSRFDPSFLTFGILVI